ncbi:FG-GAP repeat domain-containing protein [Streptomyces sp. NPDC057257]|uniref:FG-GAP repeat domain-containing protein n=1 Tax=Streptomyces sp. NPDC057257 TaxID=3346071 RepID=UPI0036337B86
MKGRTFVRRRLLGGVASVAVLVLAVGAPGVVGSAGAAPAVGAPGETVLPAGVRTVPRDAGLEGYGDTGLLSQPEGVEHQQWTDYATGQSRDLTDFSRWDGIQGHLGLAQSDTAYEVLGRTPDTIRFRDIATGADRGTVTVPDNLYSLGVAGVAVVAYEGEGPQDMTALHVLRPAAGGGTSDTVVSGFPAGVRIQGPVVRDARSLVLHYLVPTDDPGIFLAQLAVVDLRAATVTPVFAPYKPNLSWKPLLTHDYVGWWLPNLGARLVRRDDPQGPAVDVPVSTTAGKIALTVVGDHLVSVEDHTRALLTKPLTGGDWRQLLPQAEISLTQAPDGSAVVTGGSGPEDWGVQRVTQASGGDLTVTKILDLPPVPAPVDGLALAAGMLTYTDRTSTSSSYEVMWNTRTVSAGSPPEVGPVRSVGGRAKPCAVSAACLRFQGLADGSVVYDDGPGSMSGSIHRRRPDGLVDTVMLGDPDIQVVATDGMDTLASDGRKLYVFDWAHLKVLATRPAAAGALWGGQLWTAAATPGHLTLTRLASGNPAVDVGVGSGCAPDEVQAVGRFVYWACTEQGRAGVFDRSRGRSVAVPAGAALLADGFLIRHDVLRAKLVRTDVASGKAVTADVADLPAAGNLDGRLTSDRGVRWTLEANGNRLAYADSAERIHILTAGTLAAPVRRDHVGRDGLADLLTLSSSGTLAFQQGDGKGAFAGKVSGGGWSAKVAAVPFGDLNGDRCEDVLVRMADGSLRGYEVPCGKAPTPAMPYKKLGGGWNAYNVLTSPGDLTGDGRPDLLARKASTGDVYLFAAKSDGALAAGKRIRSAWGGFTKIVGAGDLNGDGIGDVLARDKAGTLWRYNGVRGGISTARAKVFGGWGSTYNTVVGVGDITGDGKNDLVVRDTAGHLYRYGGKGNGSFGGRVLIGSGWQGYKGIF